MAALLVLADALLLLAGILLDRRHLGFLASSVGLLGIMNFIGILLLVNRSSGSRSFEKGEMRKGMAGALLSVYFVMLSLILFGEFHTASPGVSEKVVDSLTFLAGTIVVFYFGGSSIRDFNLSGRNEKSGARQK